MMNYELLDAIGGIDEKLVSRAMEEKAVKKHTHWIRYGAVAACLCLIAAGALSTSLWHRVNNVPSPISDKSTSEHGEYNESEAIPQSAVIPDFDTIVPDEPTGKGVYIPPVELPEPNPLADMIGFVFYRGGMYMQSTDFFGDDARKIDSFVGDYLGYATGKINEWSDEDEYNQEFASTYAGRIYSVKGYDVTFRICLRAEYIDDDGNPSLRIQFLERLNGINLSTGADLFESRLHIGGNVNKVLWQYHDDWNQNSGNYHDVELDESIWEDFIDELYKGEFINAWQPDVSFYENHPNSTIYSTPNQAHLILDMEDGLSVNLRLIEGGYVGYDNGVSSGWYLVKMPGEAFDTVYDACGGTHLTDW